MHLFTYIYLFILGWSLISSASASPTQPWRLSKALDLSDHLLLSISHRTRYESLDNQYRAKINGIPASGGDQALALRTLIHARAQFQHFLLIAEMEDSRIELADSASATSSNRLTTTIANPLELLQAHIVIPFDNFLFDGSHSTIRAGRFTMDVGSRRLIARNRFRNTLNAFTGLDWQWTLANKTLRGFYVLPVQRRVAGNILDNHARLDSEDFNVRFWGVNYSQTLFKTANHGEIFLFGLNEYDRKSQPTKNRNLYTFGFRIWRKPSIGYWDYQLESVYQLGHSRRSKTSTTILNHWAHFHHGELGYHFSVYGAPRLVAQFDYASGDNNPNDHQNNRFDTLFGARRFDFGPTSTYGAFARSNLISPGVRLFWNPLNKTSMMIAARGFWRASTADVWTTAGINGSKPYIGSQLELRLRWNVLPKNLQLEAGVTHLFAGDLMNQAHKTDSTFAYSQASISF